jgi:hypothetical protein
VSAAKLRRRDLVPVSAKHHEQNDLLKGWKFLHAPPDPALACSLCGKPALYLVASSLSPKCGKHGSDF